MSMSERKMQANRVNAKKSTGPRTDEGKAAVSMNALTHGLTAKSLVIPGERKKDLVDLRENLAKDLRPVGEMESLLVDRIVISMWRLQRSLRFECGNLDRLASDARDGGRDIGDVLMNYNQGANLDRLRGLAGYEDSIERGMVRALRQLRELQEEREKRASFSFDAELG